VLVNPNAAGLRASALTTRQDSGTTVMRVARGTTT